ncbi:MAG: T9SS type A sorting domain-containing protein [Caldithrix sp.]|nr:T9SS type A sorting domain-containing protein [Caldithrix sp.]
MRRVFIPFVLVLAFIVSAMGQDVTPIKDIQYTEDASGDSPLNGQEVTISGIITAEPYAFGGSNYWIQDSSAAWSGVMVYDSDREVAEGDSVTLTGTVDEYYNMTEIVDVTAFTIEKEGVFGIEPMTVSTGEIATDSSMAEAYEGCLIKVMDLDITNPDLGYGEWEVDDGSGGVRVDDKADYFFNPADYTEVGVESITGVMDYSFSNTKIQPRLAWDVVEGGEYTRIQRIQQVRQSDLIKAFEDEISDISYMADPENEDFRGDTVTVKGIVTMPTGLSYAGDGIKFILAEPEGGPWAAILSYNEDSTAYPTLFEGDLIEMTGEIGEYQTGPANMTEFWITSPIEILDFGNELPPPNMVHTGDLRLPETAEQWGNSMVYVKDATVENYATQYELFGVDDGTGVVFVDDDSDSLAAFYEDNPLPPLGTMADSIRGWVYHHFGSYADSSAYKLEPLYIEDIVWGAGPPAVSNVHRDVDIPTAADAVTIYADIATNLTIDEAALYYEVVEDGSSSGYTKVVMSHMDGTTYEGQIPQQSEGSFINYFVMAEDTEAQMSIMPADTSVQNYCYPVTDGNLTIKDVQYSPWAIADSPFEGVHVELTGIATTDTAANNNYEAYGIQDAEGAWSGLFAFGINADLDRGDELKVYGTVTDYNPDWGFKWDNNTVVLVDSFEVMSTGNSVAPMSAETGDLTGDSPVAEAHEGVLVEISDATLTSLNSYDVTFDDGSGECLVDGDFMLSADQDPNNTFYINDDEGYLYAFGDTVRPGETIDRIAGIYTFSFGSYKIEVRDADDFGNVVGVKENFTPAPLTYELAQNFPNPFNPETRIYFEIPNSQQVQLVIYNILGQKVRTLVKDQFNAGRHTINWNGRNDAGQRMPSGVYIYRIKAGSYIDSKKMIMVK